MKERVKKSDGDGQPPCLRSRQFPRRDEDEGEDVSGTQILYLVLQHDPNDPNVQHVFDGIPL